VNKKNPGLCNHKEKKKKIVCNKLLTQAASERDEQHSRRCLAFRLALSAAWIEIFLEFSITRWTWFRVQQSIIDTPYPAVSKFSHANYEKSKPMECAK